MLKQSLTELKQYNVLNKFEPFTFVDVFFEGLWKVGVIRKVLNEHTRTLAEATIETRQTTIFITLPGYDALAPFRKHTYPCISSVSIERLFNLKPSEIEDITNKMLSKPNLSAEWINQQIRGKVCFRIDSILSEPESYWAHPQDTLKFLANFISFAEAFFRKVIEVVVEVSPLKIQFDQQPINEQGLIYVNNKVAFIYAVTEVAFLLSTMTGKSNRRASIDVKLRNTLEAIVKERGIPSLALRLYNYRNSSKTGLHWKIRKELYILCRLLGLQPSLEVANEFKETTQYLECLPYFVYRGEMRVEDKQERQVELIILLIEQGSFQSRKYALTELKNLKFRTLPFEIAEKLNQRQVLQMLISTNFNAQIFKRTLPIVEAYSMHDLLTEQHLVRIVQLHKDKHQHDLALFYDTLATFGRFLKKPSLLFFNRLLETLPFTTEKVNLIMNFSLKALRDNVHNSRNSSEENALFGVKYLQTCIKESNYPNAQCQEAVLRAFAALLMLSQFNELCESIFSEMLQNLNPRTSNLAIHLKLVQELAAKVRQEKTNKIFEIAEGKHRLSERLVDILCSLEQTEKDSIEAGFSLLTKLMKRTRFFSLDQILKLWKAPNCHKALFAFLRHSEDRNHFRITSKTISIPQARLLVEKVISDPKYNDFANMTADCYQTGDELVIYCNAANDAANILYTEKHIIRLKPRAALFGLEFYINTINECRDDAITSQAITRLIQFFVRPIGDVTNYEARLNSWKKALLILQKLRNRKVESYKTLLRELEGRQTSKVIWSTEDKTVTVTNLNNNETKTVVLPLNSSLWNFRLLLDRLFQFKGQNFKMQYCSNNQWRGTDFQIEEGFSVAMITHTPNSPVSDIYISSDRRDRHPHLIAQDNFKVQFASMVAGELYSMLLNQEIPQKLAHEVLDILDRVDTEPNLQKQMISPDFSNLDSLLNSKSIYAVSYQIKLLTPLLTLNYVKDFVAHDGINHILNIIKTHCRTRQHQILRSLVDVMKVCRLKNAFKIDISTKFIIVAIHKPLQITKAYIAFVAQLLDFVIESKSIEPQSLFQQQSFVPIVEELLRADSNDIPINSLASICEASQQFLNSILKVDVVLSRFESGKTLWRVLESLCQTNRLRQAQKPLSELIGYAFTNQIGEANGEEVNITMKGIIDVLVCQWNKEKSFMPLYSGSSLSLLSKILEGMFFSQRSPGNYRFKTKQLRQSAFNMLELLLTTNEAFEMMASAIAPMMQNAEWRVSNEWNIKPMPACNLKYRGLRNLAATCYLNSLFQQLFFVSRFRNQLLSLNSSQVPDENVLWELQQVFAQMTLSESESCSALSFCDHFIMEGQSIDTRVQMDVDEFFHALLDKLESNLKHVNKVEIIDRTFKGRLANIIRSHECEHTSERVEDFLSIKLDIINKSSIEEAFKEFIKGEVLQADNAYFCDKCNKKVKATKRACIKELPNTLILTLKRFEFDYETMLKFKLNSYFAFPFDLNLFHYTEAGLEEMEEQSEQNRYSYRLCGIICHEGSSESGHYTSYVKSEEGWLFFNDQRYELFKEDDLKEKCYGGTTEYGEERNKNAYMLVYEKVKQDVIAAEPINFNLQNLIEHRNIKDRQVRAMFDDRLWKCIMRNSLRFPKFCMLFILTVPLRSYQRREYYVEMDERLCEILNSHKDLPTWFQSELTPNNLYELGITSPIDVRYFFTSLLTNSLQNGLLPNFADVLCSVCLRPDSIPLARVIPAGLRRARQLGEGAFAELKDVLDRSKFSSEVYQSIRNSQLIEPVMVETRRESYFGVARVPLVPDLKKCGPKVDLFQAIVGCDLKMDIKQLFIWAQEAKKRRTHQCLAEIVCMQVLISDNKNNLRNFIQQVSEKLFTSNNQNVLTICIEITRCLLEGLSDDDKKARYAEVDLTSQSIVKRYLQATMSSLRTYFNGFILIEGLFYLAKSSRKLFELVSEVVCSPANKQFKQGVLVWIKSSSGFISLIQRREMTYNRDPKQLLPDFDKHPKVKMETFLNYMNEIVSRNAEKVKLRPLNPTKESIVFVEQVILECRENGAKNRYEVVRCLGHLLMLKDKLGNPKFVPDDLVIYQV